MAEQEKPTLHVDTDWKRQAQEEKRRLAEEEQKRRQQAASAAGPATGSAGASGHPAQQGGRESRQVPPASFSMLVQSLLTQALYHLGRARLGTGGGSGHGAAQYRHLGYS